MSWPARGYHLDQTRHPITGPSLPRPTSARIHVTGTSGRRTRISVNEPRELAVDGPKAARTGVRPPSRRKMSDPPATPTTQKFEPFQDNTHASPSLGSTGPSLRKERGAIAAQACDTCRSRKQRCDEQRPKCGTCQKFRLECNYREPQPTKKDKTLVEILDRIKNLEYKIDDLADQRQPLPSAATSSYPLQTNSIPSQLQASQGVSGLSAPPEPTFHFSGDGQYQYVSSVHQMLKWPAIQQLFTLMQPKLPNIDLSTLQREGPASMVALRRSTIQSLPTDSATPVAPVSSIALHDPAAARAPITVSDLTWDTMQRLSKAYFDCFNLLCPILNRQSFMADTLPALFRNGFGQSVSSTIALLVFSLGEVAIEGADGPPVHVYSGRASGIKGGTKDRPPGLELFNEARRRMGFSLTECSLENVQMFQLASLYYGTCFYPLDFWRLTNSAALACQAVITSHPSAATSVNEDLMRRAFWHCSVMETGLNLELGFPLTGLERMESMVGLPDFSGPFSEEDYISNQESHFQEHFASQIVLRRLLVEFHGILSQGTTASSTPGPMATPFSPAATCPGINPVMIQQLALQLEQWRGMLPPHLRWHEDAPGAFPDSNANVYNAPIFTPATTPISPAMPTVQPSAPTSTAPLMFTTDLDAAPARYPYALDIHVALLRSRYYYTKYLIHRPFIYKALHHPEAMGQDDAVGVAECLKACLKWPVAMSPTCRIKRLVPCSFFFTQNFFGILVLLHLSSTVSILRRIRSTLCGERFELDAGETVGLYLDWLRDFKAVDAGIEWHWEIIRVIYGLEE